MKNKEMILFALDILISERVQLKKYPIAVKMEDFINHAKDYVDYGDSNFRESLLNEISLLEQERSVFTYRSINSTHITNTLNIL